MKKILITEDEVIAAYRRGEQNLSAGKEYVFTPLALDRIKALGMSIGADTPEDKSEKTEKQTKAITDFSGLKVCIGGDHTGFQLRKVIIQFLQGKGIAVEDLGSYSEESCDYPDFAKAVASLVSKGSVHFGIVVDATGNPSAITANKFKGVRAANCFNEFIAKSAREHNNANILALGAKAIGEETVKSILEAWLSSQFLGERHQKRLDKIAKVEELNFRS
ncbi:MAG: ribose 5-phosphate isomerase B [Ignavibacteriales bacterium]|nr:Galactose-6-phosphate isomerase subunit LacA [Ignavibacteriaceae bacterium]MBZ0196769.1 ribose 5-phosphate isomerase B [Ignavibacteriaceae bacterium]MCZ2143608.1 ribose 5-phosphate isomerase B [Ignavibacteriales bacterium]WKZ73183.1 MAG: ribose 5-phosphate isomerase B [Ignavibacteriaceae bacterium]